TVEDGEIKIAVDVVPYSKSTVDEAFRIKSTGNDEQLVWVSSAVDGVEFHRSDTGEPVERVTLNPGESIGVGLTVDSSRDLDGEFFTIRVGSGSEPDTDPDTETDTDRDTETDTDRDTDDDYESPSIWVTEVTLQPREIQANETASIAATLENNGTATGTQAVGLEVDGTVVAQRKVRLHPGKSEQVTFERLFGRIGDFDIAIKTLGEGTDSKKSPGNLSVTHPPEGPVFVVREGSVSTTDARPGDPVDVTATIVNVGDQPGTFTTELAVNGIVYQTKTLEISPGEEVTGTFTRAFRNEGTYTVNVSATAAGKITVDTTGEHVWPTQSEYVLTPVIGTVGLIMLFSVVAIKRRRLREYIRWFL
ncbi:CARDB domain-containing protein, partial [Halodesulfurarchaeum sp.]|uniref:CARDB domain-containing protein n=1 Tax=Halodesulfurarchaeum sp. TaxID=1980530 RepID=UPI002FC3ABFF